jgi:hypothetical protein
MGLGQQAIWKSPWSLRLKGNWSPCRARLMLRDPSHRRCNPVQGATATLASTATLATWNLQLAESKGRTRVRIPLSPPVLTHTLRAPGILTISFRSSARLPKGSDERLWPAARVRRRPLRMAERGGGDQATSLDTGVILAFSLKTLSGS